jgi:aspartyl aminopeptidase
MRRLALVLGVLVVTLAYSTTASADPSHNVNPPLTYSCDNGQTVVINPGTVTNQSHQAFVINSTSILVITYLAFSDSSGTLVLFETAPGLTSQGLVTCTTDLGGVTITARGFFTPGV